MGRVKGMCRGRSCEFFFARPFIVFCRGGGKKTCFTFFLFILVLDFFEYVYISFPVGPADVEVYRE